MPTKEQENEVIEYQWTIDNFTNINDNIYRTSTIKSSDGEW